MLLPLNSGIYSFSYRGLMLNCSLSWCLEFKILPPRTSCWTSAPRLTFMAGAPPGDAFEKHRLHIMLVDSPRWVRFLKLTDWLRTDGQKFFSKPKRFPGHPSSWLLKRPSGAADMHRQHPWAMFRAADLLIVSREGTTPWVKSKRPTQWGVWWSHVTSKARFTSFERAVLARSASTL